MKDKEKEPEDPLLRSSQMVNPNKQSDYIRHESKLKSRRPC
jgi:hypothetical protein